jgi:hypothetical protein
VSAALAPQDEPACCLGLVMVAAKAPSLRETGSLSLSKDRAKRTKVARPKLINLTARERYGEQKT